MTPGQSRALFADASERGYAVLAVNADTTAAIADCLETAAGLDAPILIEASRWQLAGRSFGRGDAVQGLRHYLTWLACAADAPSFRDVPVGFHVDHIRGPGAEGILTAAAEGVLLAETGPSLCASSISIDAGDLTEQENVERALRVAEHAVARGQEIFLELEHGIDDVPSPTAVADRLLGAMETRAPGAVGLWAPGLGTRHGHTEGGYPEFDPCHVGRHRDAALRVTGRRIGIVLHGSSGVGLEQLEAGVKLGLVKVNWSTAGLALRVAGAAAYYRNHPEVLSPGHPRFKDLAMDDAVEKSVGPAYRDAVREMILVLGGAGHGRRLVCELKAII